MQRPLVVPLFAALLFAAPAPAAVPSGPAGTAFYTPAKAVPSKHGTPIWQRKLTGPAVLKSAKSNRLLLYSWTGTAGRGGRGRAEPRGPGRTGLRRHRRPQGQSAEGRLAGGHLGARHHRDRGRLRAEHHR